MWAQLDDNKIQADLPGLEQPYTELYGLLHRTLNSSVNNAALLMGPRGSGRHALLESVLNRLRDEVRREGRGFIVVRLHGALHTDDTLSIREIVHQLCKYHEIEALKPSMDFHAHMAFLLEILSAGSAAEHPIFFILDQFDAFTRRHKQTLLYNLADLLQSGRAQMALIGVTSELDVYERMEKRIRSRMSHRRILMGRRQSTTMMVPSMTVNGLGMDASTAAPSASASTVGVGRKETPVQLQSRLEWERLVRILRSCLEIHPPGYAQPDDVDEQDEASQQHQKGAGGGKARKQSTKRKLQLSPSSLPSLPPSLIAHNAAIATLFNPTSSPRLHAQFHFHLKCGKQIGWFKNVCKMAVSRACDDDNTDKSDSDQILNPDQASDEKLRHLKEEDVLWAINEVNKDECVEALKLCSVLQLSLLVSLMHLSRRHLPLLNFHQIYECYLRHYKLAAVGAGGVGGMNNTSSDMTSNGGDGVNGGLGVGMAGASGTVPFYPEFIARKAFESLLSSGRLLVWSQSIPSHPFSAGATSGADPIDHGREIQRTFLPVKLRVDEHTLLATIKQKNMAPTWLVQWATRGSS